MLRRAFTALVAAHFELYQTAVYFVGLVAAIYFLSDFGLLLSAAYAGEIIVGFWAVQGTFAVIEKAKQRRTQRRDQSLD